jgi:integrase
MPEGKSQNTWVRVEPGIRCRQHPTRKNGLKPDVYYVLRFTVDGKSQQEALGWASEGITLTKARIELSKLKEAKRTGEGARSLRERRQQTAQQQKEQKLAEQAASAAKITVAEFWQTIYWPAQAHKASGSLSAEHALWTKWIKPAIGILPITSLTAADLEKIKSAMLNAEKASASIKYAFAVVSQLWNFAQKNEIVTGLCPTKYVALPKKDNRRQRYLTHEESHKLLNALAQRSPISYDMAILGLDCGLRFGEVAALCWEDCDFERGQMFIRDPKAKANRFAFMTSRVKKVLEDREKSTGLIFFDKQGNKISRISKTFRRIADEMFNQNINDPRLRVCFHTLRHTFASWLVEGGVTLYEVKELMGHADLSMTQRYSHLSPEGLKNSIKILERQHEKQ